MTVPMLEKNFIIGTNSIINLYRGLNAEYIAKGSGGSKVVLHTHKKDNLGKIVPRTINIYLTQYSDKNAYKRLNSLTYGNMMIDEVDQAYDNDELTPSFLSEMFSRRARNAGKILATSNGAFFRRKFYVEYLDRCTPLDGYRVPLSIEKILDAREDRKEDWIYVHYNIDDGIYSEEQKRDMKETFRPGTLTYQSKIAGERVNPKGTIFLKEDIAKCTRPVVQSDYKNIHLNSIGVDTAYSSKSKDSHAICPVSITNDGYIIIGKNAVWKFNNASNGRVMLASDMATKIAQENEKLHSNIFIDNADANLILTTKRMYPHLTVAGSYKKFGIVNRIKLITDLLAHGKLIIDPSNKDLLEELENVGYSLKPNLVGQWAEDSENHLLDAFTYSWTPYVSILQSQLNNKRRSY